MFILFELYDEAFAEAFEKIHISRYPKHTPNQTDYLCKQFKVLKIHKDRQDTPRQRKRKHLKIESLQKSLEKLSVIGETDGNEIEPYMESLALEQIIHQ